MNHFSESEIIQKTAGFQKISLNNFISDESNEIIDIDARNVPIFDADIYGPSIPTMLGYENQPVVSYDGKTMEPFETCGIKSMSIGSMIDKDTPLIWRGAKACGAIQQLFNDTNWGEIDVMVIDMPPGTGDIQITLSQKMNIDEAVIVSTPQDIALIDAVKGVNMFKKTGNINSYLEFNELRNIEENMKVNIDETNKSKWDNYCRK